MTLEVNKEAKSRWRRVRNAVKMTAMHRRLARMGEARKQAYRVASPAAEALHAITASEDGERPPPTHHIHKTTESPRS